LFTLDTLPYLGIRLLSFPEIAYLKRPARRVEEPVPDGAPPARTRLAPGALVAADDNSQPNMTEYLGYVRDPPGALLAVSRS
jgi:hypothetical protein